jgi:PAS domain S-box-containing protein
VRSPFFEAVMNASCDGIFVAEITSGNLIFANNTACNLLGYTLSEIEGMHQSELHPLEHRQEIIQKFGEFVSNSDYKEFNSKVITKNGEIISVKITSANLFEYEGNTYIVGYFKDIRLEENMTRIAYLQSHVIRRPLANILGLCNLIKDNIFETEEDLIDLTNNILTESEELDKVITEIVHYTRVLTKS